MKKTIYNCDKCGKELSVKHKTLSFDDYSWNGQFKGKTFEFCDACYKEVEKALTPPNK